MSVSRLASRVRVTLAAPDPWRRVRDYVGAQALRRLPVGLRRQLFAGERHFCPVCGSILRTFITLHRDYNLLCPVCWSLQRHRFIWMVFERHADTLLPTRRPWKMLHLAPEPSLAARFAALPGVDYLSADMYDPRAMVRMDICAIQYPAETFDLIYCSHVLEHVEDDRQALAEFHRVLRPEGRAVMIVPITSPQTFEDPTITSPQARERVFGQHDHVRRYGMDVVERLAAAGFRVATLRRAELVDEAEMERQGLYPDEVVFVLDKKTDIR